MLAISAVHVLIVTITKPFSICRSNFNHIFAVFFYQFYKRQALIQAMFHGRKMLAEKGITSQKVILALLIASLVAIGIYILVEVLPPQQDYSDYF